MQRFQVSENDLIMSCSGTIGRVSIIKEDSPEGVINQALLKITPNKDVSARYLKGYFDSDVFQGVISANSQGGIINNVVSVKQLSELEVPLPPLNEQAKIVGQADEQNLWLEGAKNTVKYMEGAINNTLSELWND